MVRIVADGGARPLGQPPQSSEVGTGVFQIGGGVDVTLLSYFKIRGEARDFLSGVPPVNVNTGNSRQHNLFVSGGLVWQF
jgi:hypothetical protein